MHDCGKFEDGLVDLVFGEIGIDEKQRRLLELEDCYRCLNEYRSITESLGAFDTAVEASLPDRSYWARQHEGLRRHLDRATRASTADLLPWWKRGLVARISLPAPAVAFLAFALLGLSVLAIRQSRANDSKPPAQVSTSNNSPVRTVEVPVIHEKVVTRTVYVTKRDRARDGSPRLASVPSSDRNASTGPSKQNGAGSLLTRANLSDFQPPDEMRIRIVKRSNSDEK